MRVENGVINSDQRTPMLEVTEVKTMPDHHLRVRFNTGESRIVDFRPLLDAPAFIPLQNDADFAGAYIDHGFVCWNGGDIDISTDYLYAHGVQQ